MLPCRGRHNLMDAGNEVAVLEQVRQQAGDESAAAGELSEAELLAEAEAALAAGGVAEDDEEDEGEDGNEDEPAEEGDGDAEPAEFVQVSPKGPVFDRDGEVVS